MNKVFKFGALTALLTMSIGLSGCQNVAAPAVAPGKAPEVVLQEAVDKLASVTSYNFAASLAGDLKAPVNPETGVAESPSNIKFNLKLDGGLDLKDLKDPKMNLNVNADGSADQDGGAGQFSLKLNKENFYVNLMKLEGRGAIQIPDEMIKPYLAKWFTMPIPAEFWTEFSKNMPQSAEENLTPEQKQIRELIKNTKFFKEVKYVNDENVGTESSAHYTASLDKDAFADFVSKASQIQEGKTVTPEELAQMKEAMAMFDFAGDMYVGKTSGALNRVKGTLSFKSDAKKPSPTGNVSVDLSLTELNKPVTVQAPADAQPFPQELLAGMGA